MAKERVLVVDDEEGVRNSLRNILRDESYTVEVADSGERCLEMVRSAPYHAVFLDVWLPGRDGLSILEEVLSQPLPPRVIMISGHADVPLAHRAGRLGAFDFIEKPLSLEKVALTLRNAVADRKKDERILQLREQLLFGHVKGAFTGASDSKPGRFVLADGGTLFLDEIADMSMRTQAKVLRVLQEQAFEPVGGSTLRVDVRVIAATNKDLKTEIAAGRFREDLYFRLNVVPLRVPPLRERPEDVPPLARHFVEQFSRAYGRIKSLAPGALPALQSYRWPGNVRELKNVIERLVILTAADVIALDDVRRMMGADAEPAEDLLRGFATLREGRENFERQFIQRRLQEAGGNVVRAAELLGLERSNLYRKMRALGIRGGGDS